MIPTITSFTQKILSKYPKTKEIHLHVYDATNDKMYDTWTAEIAEVVLDLKHDKQIVLTAEDHYELFGTIALIKLGKNNKSRQIDSKHVFHVNIVTKLEQFTTKDGKTISYYPSHSDIYTYDDAIRQILRKAQSLTRNLLNLSKNNHRLPKLSDVPDFDSD